MKLTLVSVSIHGRRAWRFVLAENGKVPQSVVSALIAELGFAEVPGITYTLG